VVVTNFSAPLDANVKLGTYRMHVGMYTFPDIKGIQVVDKAGQPIAAYVEVGPIEIK
jgi:hypothetical protein